MSNDSSAPTESTGSDTPGTTPAAAGEATNEVKDKFRQALDRKRGSQAERDAAGDGLTSSKIHGEHAAAKTQRTFRRKSGG
jgi:hypothetical protein